MWQRFSERARKVVFYAQEEAQKFGDGYVSTEHLLLGLCREEDSTAAKMLEAAGVSLVRIRGEVEKQLPRGDNRPSQDMTLTPRAKRVIDLAYDEARGLNHGYIGTEHLLLGLIREGDGLAGRVLDKLGLKLESMRELAAQLAEGEHRDSSFFEQVKERYREAAQASAGRGSQRAPAAGQSYAPERLLLLVLGDEPGSFLEELLSRQVGPGKLADLLAGYLMNSYKEEYPYIGIQELLDIASEIAAELNHTAMTGDHLVAAILKRGESYAALQLGQMGITLDSMLAHLRE